MKTFRLLFAVEAMSDVFLSINPSVEIGGQWSSPGRAVRVRPYGRPGYLAPGLGSTPELAAKFLGAPDDVKPFVFESGLERDYVEYALGFDLLNSRNNLIRLEGSGVWGNATLGYSIDATKLEFAAHTYCNRNPTLLTGCLIRERATRTPPVMRKIRRLDNEGKSCGRSNRRLIMSRAAILLKWARPTTVDPKAVSIPEI